MSLWFSHASHLLEPALEKLTKAFRTLKNFNFETWTNFRSTWKRHTKVQNFGMKGCFTSCKCPALFGAYL